ncbi:SAV_2336 N-terminal domain-related protein [Streptomyces sp. NPDC050504]|uniref:SAV_2336 N-terminal domain-related protein n=1 Tax=Streptomyces sp. NPDC050504 TaxID=3365618 RepID=UPI00379B9FB9
MDDDRTARAHRAAREERPAPRAMSAGLDALADLLADANGGTRPTGTELAELLWLAGHCRGPKAADGAAPPPPDPATPLTAPPAAAPPPVPPPAGPGGGRIPLLTPAAPEPSDPEDSAAAPNGPAPSAPEPDPAPDPAPNAPDGRDRTAHAALTSPAPPMLARPLLLQRALRPLRRTIASPTARELDEEATAHRMARVRARPGRWLPVLRPVRERWLRLRLVHDTGPTMPVWQPLVRELHTVCVQTGIFRTVETAALATDGTLTGSPAHAPVEHTVTLLVSDCTGPQWREGAAGTRWYRTLRGWAERMPVAVVQPLPERLWRQTALPTVAGLLSSPAPGAPDAALAFAPYGESWPDGMVPLPVLEPTPQWLGHWAHLVAGTGGQVPGAVAALGTRPPLAPEGPEADELAPDELVLRFRSLASPEAFRLAGHLTAGRPDLPVMRLVQAAVERHPQPQHLAEIVLSGMLKAVPGPAGSYVFRPGVRDVLRRTVPRSAYGRTQDLLVRVGKKIDERAGTAAGEFRALVEVAPEDGGAPEDGRGERPGDSFATVTRQTVRNLGGADLEPVGSAPDEPDDPDGPGRPDEEGAPDEQGRLPDRYRVERMLKAGHKWFVWQAWDSREERFVALKTTPRPDNWQGALNRLRAARQASVRFPEHLAGLYDFGVTGDRVFVVMELLDGKPLSELIEHSKNGMPELAIRTAAYELLTAMDQLTEYGVEHDDIKASRIKFASNGRLKLCDYGLDVRPRPLDRNRDLYALGGLLNQMATLAHPRRAVVPLAVRRPDLSAEIRGLIQELTAPEHARRQAAARSIDTLRAAPDDPPRRQAALRYRVLGPLSVSRGGTRVTLGSPEQHAVLAQLVMRRGHATPIADLVRGVWGKGAPPGAEGTVRVALSRLSKVLGQDAVVRRSQGYALELAPADEVDLDRHWALAEQARRRTDADDPEGAAELLREALRLWPVPTPEQGPSPLDGVPGPAADETRTVLAEEWFQLVASLTEIDIAQGRAEAALERVKPLLLTHPGRQQLMSLLARAFQEVDPDALAEFTTHIATSASAYDPGAITLMGALNTLIREAGVRFGPLGGERRVVVFEYLTGGGAGAAPQADPREETRLRQDLRALVADVFAGTDLRPDHMSGLAMRGRVTVGAFFEPPDEAGTLQPRLVRLLRERLLPALTSVRNRPPLLAAVVPFRSAPWDAAAELAPPALLRARLAAAGAPGAVVVPDSLLPRLDAEGEAEAFTEVGGGGQGHYCLLGVRQPDSDPFARVRTVVFGLGSLVLLQGTPSTHWIRTVLDAMASDGMSPDPRDWDGSYPSDLLRQYPSHRYIRHLREAVADHELAAVQKAKADPEARSLVRALHASGREVAVVSDLHRDAVVAHLEAFDLLDSVRGGVFGRPADPSRMMPSPYVLNEMLAEEGKDRKRCLMIGTSPRNAAAARAAGVPFLGVARWQRDGAALKEAGATRLARSLGEVRELLEG